MVANDPFFVGSGINIVRADSRSVESAGCSKNSCRKLFGGYLNAGFLKIVSSLVTHES